MSSQLIWFKWRPPSSRFAERFISHVFIIGNLLSTKCENTNLYEGCTLLEEEDGTAEEQEEGEMGRGGRRRIGELEERGEDGQWIRARDYCVYLRWRAGEEENGATNEVDVTKIFEKGIESCITV